MNTPFFKFTERKQCTRFQADLCLTAIACLITTASSSAAEVDACPRQRILSAASQQQTPTELPARFALGEHGPVRAIALRESETATDHFRYSALVDQQRGEVWVYRYGGLDGAIAWFGPLAISSGSLAACPPTSGALWLGKNKVLTSSGVQTASAAASRK